MSIESHMTCFSQSDCIATLQVQKLMLVLIEGKHAELDHHHHPLLQAYSELLAVS